MHIYTLVYELTLRQRHTHRCSPLGRQEADAETTFADEAQRVTVGVPVHIAYFEVS